MELLHQSGLKILFCFSLGLFTSLVLIPLLLQQGSGPGANRKREFHHAHTTRVSRLGGSAVFTAFLVLALVLPHLGFVSAANINFLGVVVISSLAMFTLGLWDDLYILPSKFKFLVQNLIALGVYLGGIRIEVFKNPFTNTDLSLGIAGFFATILWLVVLPNLINFIDGIDGLAGGVCLMLMCLLANVGLGDSGFSMLLSIGVAGALVGFLKFNYPPAKIYMGDGGAYFLGFLIAILSIVNSHKGTIVAALIAPAFALALPIVDVGLAVLRRSLKGLPVFRPDQKHIHHYLVTLGLSRERTVLILYTFSFICLSLAFGVFWFQGRLLPLFSGLLFLVLMISGYVSGITKNWSILGRQLLVLRKETRYALILSQWLEMEVERYDSVNNLWLDYEFVVKKLHFSKVRLEFPAGSQIWHVADFNPNSGDLRTIRHPLGDGFVIEFTSDSKMLSDDLFQTLADLAAETWHKAARRYRLIDRKTAMPPVTVDSQPPRERLEPSHTRGEAVGPAGHSAGISR